MSLEEDFKKWVELDNNQKIINDKIKKIRDEKNELSEKIFRQCKQRDIETFTVNISDGCLNIQDVKQANTITYKFLDESLKSYFKNEDEANKLLQYIKEKRTYNIAKTIKRTYY